jgi:MFS family permease
MRLSLLPEPGPRRVYGLATLVNTFGFGLVVTSLVLYFTRVVHLGSLQVGLGLTISGLIGLVTGVPVGTLADRHGPRTVVRVTYLVQFLSALGYLFIRDFAAFVVIATVDMLAMNANQAADGGAAAPGRRRGRGRLPLRHLMIGLCLTFGTAGWIGLGAFFAVLGLTAPAIARRGERTRAADPAEPLPLTGSTNYR